MKKITTLSVALLTMILLEFNSCSSKKDNPAPQKSQSELLTAAKLWQLSKLELFDVNTNAWVSEPVDGDFYYASFVDFTSITFASNGTLTMKGEGGGSHNSYTDTGTWSLSGSVLTVTPTDESVQTSTITTFNETTFVTSWAISKTRFSEDGGTGTSVNATQIRETFSASK